MCKPKHETCRYAMSTGELIVYVKPGCPNADMIHGSMVSSKIRCEGCLSWRGRPATINQAFEDAVKEMIAGDKRR